MKFYRGTSHVLEQRQALCLAGSVALLATFFAVHSSSAYNI